MTSPYPCTEPHDRAYATTKRQVIKTPDGPQFMERATTGWICRKCGLRGRATGRHRGDIDYAKTVVQFHWTRQPPPGATPAP